MGDEDALESARTSNVILPRKSERDQAAMRSTSTCERQPFSKREFRESRSASPESEPPDSLKSSPVDKDGDNAR